MARNANDDLIYDLRSAVTTKDLEIEILRHRLKLKEQASATSSTASDQSSGMHALIEAENQELHAQVWKLEQHVAILEDRLLVANEDLRACQCQCPPRCSPRRTPMAGMDTDATPEEVNQATKVFGPRDSTGQAHGREALEELRQEMFTKDVLISDLLDQLSRCEAVMGHIIAHNKDGNQIDIICDDPVGSDCHTFQQYISQTECSALSSQLESHAAEVWDIYQTLISQKKSITEQCEVQCQAVMTLQAQVAAQETQLQCFMNENSSCSEICRHNGAPPVDDDLQQQMFEMEAELLEERQKVCALERRLAVAQEGHEQQLQTVKMLQQEIVNYQQKGLQWALDEEHLSHQASNANARISDLEQQLKLFQPQSDELDKERQKVRLLQDRVAELLQQSSDMQRLRRDAARVEALGTALLACTQELEAVKAQLVEEEAKRTALEALLPLERGLDVRPPSVAIQTEVSEMQSGMEQLMVTEALLTEERAKVDALQSRVGELLQRAQATEATLAKCEEELQRLQQPGLIPVVADVIPNSNGNDATEEEEEDEEAIEEEEEDLETVLQEKIKQVAQLERLLNAAPSKAEMRALKTRLEQNEAEVSALEGEICNLQTQLQEANAVITLKEMQLHSLQEHCEELQRASKTKEKPSELRPPIHPDSCSQCEALATQLSEQQQKFEDIIMDLKFEIEKQTVELAARAVNITHLHTQIKQMEDDIKGVDALKKQIQELTASKDFLATELETLQLNDYHHSGHRHAKKDKVLVVADNAEKRTGWRDLISSKHQVKYNAVELPTTEGELLKGAVIKSRSGQGVCVTFGEDVEMASPGHPPAGQNRLRGYRPYALQSPASAETASPSKYILAQNTGSPGSAGRPSVLCRSPSSMQCLQ